MYSAAAACWFAGWCRRSAQRSSSPAINRVFEARDAHDAGAPVEETTPWFEPFEPEPEYAAAVVAGRTFVNTGSGTWIADSPRLLFQLLETFEDLGLREKIRAYLGVGVRRSR